MHRNTFKKSLGYFTLRFWITSRFETIDSLLSLISWNRDTCVHENFTDVLGLTSSVHLAKINSFAFQAKNSERHKTTCNGFVDHYECWKDQGQRSSSFKTLKGCLVENVLKLLEESKSLESYLDRWSFDLELIWALGSMNTLMRETSERK